MRTIITKYILPMPSTYSFRSLYESLAVKFSKVNLFETRSIDLIVVRRQILTTRLFLVLFISSLSILIFYTTISVQSITETIKQPNLATYTRLEKKYPETLQCSCGQIAIPYGAFYRATPFFHQVCTSNFVSQLWIDHIFRANLTYLWPFDVRASLSAMWQIIAGLCRSATNSITDALDEFADEALITSFTLSEKPLQAKIQTAFTISYQTALYNLARSLTIIHRLTQANGYLTGTSVNFIVATSGNIFGDIASLFMVDTKNYGPSTNEWCLCQRHGSCPRPGAFYLFDFQNTDGVYDHTAIIPNRTVPGIIMDCLPLLMVFASTLECFYNQSCIDQLLSLYPENVSISALNNSLKSRFTPTTPMQNVIDELFIEEIVNETNFTAYYEKCNPTQCTYTYQLRFYWLYVVTTVAALIGGLNVAFCLMAPFLLDLALWLKRKIRRRTTFEHDQNQMEPPMTVGNKLKHTAKKSLKFLKEFNLFPDKYSEDEFLMIRGRIITRLYVVSISISMIILAVYTSQSVQTVTGTVLWPSVKQYEHLYEAYQDTLQCPCDVISIPYGKFMTITPTFHQICSSELIQSWWYRSLVYHWTITWTIDFRFISSAYFRTLAMFCEVANLTQTSAYYRFSTTIFVNSYAIPRSSFSSQTDAFIGIFKNWTTLDFLYNIELINDLLHGDQYASGMETNLALVTLDVTAETLATKRPFYVSPVPWSSRNQGTIICSCPIDPSCSAEDDRSLSFEMKGIQIGCFILDTTLKSSLTCWYNSTCIDSLITGFAGVDVPISRIAKELNHSLPSKFSPNEPFEQIINEMMIESYTSSASFETFYNTCRPISCVYSYQQRSNLVYMLTTVIGLFGGLNIVLRWMILGIVKFFHRRKQNEQPSSICSVTTHQSQTTEG